MLGTNITGIQPSLCLNAWYKYHRYTTLESAVKAAGIPYTPAQGAMFFCINLRKYLHEDTFAGERALFQVMR
jgi:hypothetical protein